tara:strand:- start:183 stop:518 length:336 start_codon:yes stop_codon:yes gene_type:complete
VLKHLLLSDAYLGYATASKAVYGGQAGSSSPIISSSDHLSNSEFSFVDYFQNNLMNEKGFGSVVALMNFIFTGWFSFRWRVCDQGTFSVWSRLRLTRDKRMVSKKAIPRTA